VRAEPRAEGDGLHVVERFHGSGRGERGRVEGVEKRSVRDGMAGCKYGPARDDCWEQRLEEGRGCPETAGVGFRVCADGRKGVEGWRGGAIEWGDAGFHSWDGWAH
jgi:hypothetical protein